MFYNQKAILKSLDCLECKYLNFVHVLNRRNDKSTCFQSGVNVYKYLYRKRYQDIKTFEPVKVFIFNIFSRNKYYHQPQAYWFCTCAWIEWVWIEETRKKNKFANATLTQIAIPLDLKIYVSIMMLKRNNQEKIDKIILRRFDWHFSIIFGCEQFFQFFFYLFK